MLKASTPTYCAARARLVTQSNRPVYRLLAAVFLTGSLAACAQPHKLMYNWQSYQAGVYDYLKEENSDYAAQAQLLEQNIEVARSADQALPPGFHAHLGMLYLKQGKADKAVEHLQSEKLAFPEATSFMEFLLRNATASAEKAPLPVPDSSTTAPGASTAIKAPSTQEIKKGT